MACQVSRHCCCVCGKKGGASSGVKLHLFPKDARRRLQWLRTLNIAYDKHMQGICDDHFEPKYFASKGRLLRVAVPNPPDACVEAITRTNEAQIFSLRAQGQVHIDLTDTCIVSDSQIEVPQPDAFDFGVMDVVQHSPVQSAPHHHPQANTAQLPEEQEPHSLVYGGTCTASSYLEEGKKSHTSRRKISRAAENQVLEQTEEYILGLDQQPEEVDDDSPSSPATSTYQLPPSLSSHHQPSTLARHHQTSTLARHHQPSTLARHHQPSTLARHHQPSTLARHHQPSTLARHHQPSTLARHHQPSTLARHHQTSTIDSSQQSQCRTRHSSEQEDLITIMRNEEKMAGFMHALLISTDHIADELRRFNKSATVIAEQLTRFRDCSKNAEYPEEYY